MTPSANMTTALSSGLLIALLAACGWRGPHIEVRKEAGRDVLLLEGAPVHTAERPILEPQAVVLHEREQPVAIYWKEQADNGDVVAYYTSPQSEGWAAAQPFQTELLLRRRQADPLKDGWPTESRLLRRENRDEQRLRYVQFVTPAQDAYLSLVHESDVEILSPLHNQALLVRCDAQAAARLRALPFVRWVGDAPFADIVSEDGLLEERSPLEQVDLLMAKPGEALREEIAARFGDKRIISSSRFIVTANLRTAEVRKLFEAGLIQWVERAVGAPEEDMTNVREIGGANFLSGLSGLPSEAYTGIGIRGHVLEGIYADHPDFAANAYRSAPIAVDDPTPSPHGQATFGILFGSGAGNAEAKGLLPNAQGLYTNYQIIHQGSPWGQGKGTRYELVKRLVQEHQVMFQTASWGYKATKDYTSRSYEMDAIVFDYDIPITQSAGNNGNREMRPQAWAKNVITVGAIFQFETHQWTDDKWQGSTLETPASVGPAADGRIKPDLIANYDGILTTSMEGYRPFTGTSAATPIVAGHLGLVLEMWTNGLFGNALAYPVENRFANRPHFTTAKALLINGARQYSFQGEDSDLTRTHQGWGYPNLRGMYEKHLKTHVVNEDEILTQGSSYQRDYLVGKSEESFKATMVFADPVATPMNLQARVNNLDLKVTAPDGTTYWGNVGLLQGPESQPGGAPSVVDTVENVFIANPMAGWWRVEVIATEILEDGHVETKERDADFALVVTGATEYRAPNKTQP